MTSDKRLMAERHTAPMCFITGEYTAGTKSTFYLDDLIVCNYTHIFKYYNYYSYFFDKFTNHFISTSLFYYYSFSAASKQR